MWSLQERCQTSFDIVPASSNQVSSLHPHCQPHPKHKHWCSCRHYAISKARGVTMEAALPRVLQPKLVAILDPKSFFRVWSPIVVWRQNVRCRSSVSCVILTLGVPQWEGPDRCPGTCWAAILVLRLRLSLIYMWSMRLRNQNKAPRGANRQLPLQTAGCFGTWRVSLHLSELIWRGRNYGWGLMTARYNNYIMAVSLMTCNASLMKPLHFDQHLQASCIQRSWALIWLFLFRDERTQIVWRLRDR